jgi:type VII secretion integral membrane protein EccD
VSEYSRVTLLGRRRRVDAVLPADEAVAGLMPDLLELLDDPVDGPARNRQLVTVAGDVLPGELTLRQAEVADGAVLRLVAQADAPPVPVVTDVTEEAADDADARVWRWGPVQRRVMATVAAVGLLGLAAVLLRLVAPTLAGAAAGGLVAAGLLAVAGAVLRVMGTPSGRRLGPALIAAAWAVATVALWTAADAGGWPSAARWGAVAAAGGATLAALGVLSPLGRGGVVGGVALLALAAAWSGGAVAGLAPARLAAVLGVGSVLLLGVLPRLALTASGLTGLDDRRLAGGRVGRRDVRAALDHTHRGMALAVVTTAGSVALAGWLLAAADTGPAGRWTAPLAALLAVVLLTRARAFPLTVEVAALVGAATVVGGGVLLTWLRAGAATGPLLAVAGLAALGLGVLAADPAEHVRAWLRRAGDWLEAGAVAASVPVALGVFGTYGELLRTF